MRGFVKPTVAVQSLVQVLKYDIFKSEDKVGMSFAMLHSVLMEPRNKCSWNKLGWVVSLATIPVYTMIILPESHCFLVQLV